jgi:hypothetical protein
LFGVGAGRDHCRQQRCIPKIEQLKQFSRAQGSWLRSPDCRAPAAGFV